MHMMIDAALGMRNWRNIAISISLIDLVVSANACYQQLTAFDQQWCDSACEHAKGIAIAYEPTEAVLHETYPQPDRFECRR